MIPFGASIEYNPASIKEKTAIQQFSPRAVRGIFAGYHFHSGGVWSGGYLVYDESSLRKATAWHYVHLHRIREIVLPMGKEFTFPAKDDRFFDNLEPKQKPEDDIVSSSSSGSVSPEREATSAESSVVKEYWIDRPDVAIRIHSAPRRELCVLIVNEDDAPLAPVTAIDVTRRTRTKSEICAETEIDDMVRRRQRHSRPLRLLGRRNSLRQAPHPSTRLRYHLGKTQEAAGDNTPTRHLARNVEDEMLNAEKTSPTGR